MKKLLFGLLVTMMCVSLFFLVMGKNKTLGKRFLPAEERNSLSTQGDLYALSRIDDFKEHIKEIQLQERLSVENIDVVIMGDSFFNTGFDSDPIPNALEKISGMQVFYKSNSKQNLIPRQYLAASGYRKGGSRLFIWETVERKSLERIHDLEITEKSLVTRPSKSDPSSLEHRLFDRVDVEYFIKNNKFIQPMNQWLRNRAYDWFGDLGGKTPIASKRPHLLFLDEEVDFYKNVEKLKDIDQAAELVAREAKILKDLYNLTLVFVVIPNKLTVYGDTVFGTTAYDHYIPRLQSALTRRNVSFIDMYSLFTEYRKKHPDEMLYYAGDTHTTPIGKNIVIDALRDRINSTRR